MKDVTPEMKLSQRRLMGQFGINFVGWRGTAEAPVMSISFRTEEAYDEFFLTEWEGFPLEKRGWGIPRMFGQG